MKGPLKKGCITEKGRFAGRIKSQLCLENGGKREAKGRDYGALRERLGEIANSVYPFVVLNVQLSAKNRRVFDKSIKMSTELPNKSIESTLNPWTTLTVCPVYDNPWITVSHREVVNPSGGNGIYGVVHFKNAAIGIVPLDSDGYTWLVGQYRYPLERYSWEIPEGGGLLSEPVLESAKRELLEETGISAQHWTPLLEMHLSNSVTDEYSIAFVAQKLGFGVAQPEATEQLQIRRLPFSEAVRMVMDGAITDALSVAALLKANEWLRQGLLSV